MRVEDVDEPRAGPGELLVRMRACGICGSDLHFARYAEQLLRVSRAADPAGWSAMDLDRGVVMGHEPVGEIVEGNGLFPAGQRVFVHHHVPCGDCPRCRAGTS